mgnify:CR=1 FL=1
MNGPSASEIAENWTGPDYVEEKETCEGCEEQFWKEDISNHADGNRYCYNCYYETKEDRLDEQADRASAEEQNR